VLISEPVSWKSEFRCFVLEKQVVALSVYLVKEKLRKLRMELAFVGLRIGRRDGLR
jgi:hypothetical protein